MKLRLLKIGSFLLAISLLSMPVKAADKSIAVGVIGNIADFDTTGSETEGWEVGTAAGGSETNSTSISKSVEFASFFGEVEVRSDHFGLAWGAEIIPGDHSIGAKTRTDTAASSGEGQQVTTTATGKAQVSNMLSTYIEPTFYINEALGLYVKAGVTRVTVETLESLPESTYGNEGVFGTLIGAGIKGTHSSGLYIKLEHAETDYGTLTFQSDTGNQNTITASPEQTATRLAIGYKF